MNERVLVLVIVVIVVFAIMFSVCNILWFFQNSYLPEYDQAIDYVTTLDASNMKVKIAKVYSSTVWTFMYYDKVKDIDVIFDYDELTIGNNEIDKCRPSLRYSHKLKKFIKKENKLIKEENINKTTDFLKSSINFK